MDAKNFSLAIDGRHVTIDLYTQEVSVFDAAGGLISRQRIQVAAGSVQGIFSSLRDATQVFPTAPGRNV